MELNKIQIAPERFIPDTMTVWPEEGPEVDLVADPRLPGGLKLRPGTIKVIYAIGILGKTEFSRIDAVLAELTAMLEPGGQIYIIENDFDFILRSILGGEIKVETFNDCFIQKSYLNHDIIIGKLEKAGFINDKMAIWYDFPNMKFSRKEHQIIISAIKK